MTIQVSISTIDTANMGDYFYQIKEFLKLNGWTVAGSSDGTTGGMDAIDRIVSPTTINNNANRWVVVQSPHITPSDRIQILFGGNATGLSYGRIDWCPEADFVGATTAVPTSATALTVRNALISSVAPLRFTMLADDAPPYGWALLITSLGNIALAEGGMGLFPLDITVAPDNPGKPYVFYITDDSGASTHWRTNEISNNTINVSSTGFCVAQGNNTTLSFVAPGMTLTTDGNATIMPGGSFQDPTGADVSSPIIFQSSTYFFGSTSFARWNGTPRNHLDTLSDGVVPRARIIFGQVSLPWDGTSIPLP